MNRTKVAILVLIALLVASNAWWWDKLRDCETERIEVLGMMIEDDHAATQSLRLLPLVAKPGVSKDDVVAAARIYKEFEATEQDGFVLIGAIALKFDEGGKLIEATRRATFGMRF